MLLDEPLPEGDCRFQLHADGSGLTLERDGSTVGRASAGRLPGIDVLATSLPRLSAAQGEELDVRIAVDDQFATSPTPVKTVLSVLCLVGALGSLLWLRGERRATRPRRRPGRSALSWVRRGLDAAVVAVLLLWTLVTPMTGDDGYYAAMARNSRISGAVGNYYQLYDQNFTPFTWFYYVLGWWQGVVGDAPALQRLLAVAFGLVTWVAAAPVRRRRDGRVGAGPAGVRSACHAMLAVAFLAWWLPLDMGVRPEGVVCVCAAAGCYAVLVALRRRAAGRRVARVAGRARLRRAPDRVHAARSAARRAAAADGGWSRSPASGGHDPAALAVASSAGMVAPLVAFVDGGAARLPPRPADLPGRSRPRRAGPRRSSATASC